ncbi:primosomal protein N' [Candidatus Berkelbacteria bacterium CG10_big_fil_rev_8_21_14_0_10_43_13]|uniref:Replication restart protein PriA n=1 Tax=Candidatus Berkelbacteria bacterium CG10_big_fil_rev_8_21_14_0_10_43_13 TaxID=1974514 RepID=A0A2H0W9K2_9BACT|nr:MAG: primosomal protein N' [Candidatus Berkelbacteria bacterium CG10_big_fil_rev_8_21_14_0_10_43_13]
MIVNVIPEIKTWSDIEVFSYSVPADLTNKIKIGALVEIPLGRNKIRGVVESLKNSNDKTLYKMKNIISVIDDFVLPEIYFDVVKWISEYYLCSLGDALSLFLPPAVKRPKAGIRDKELGIRESQNIKLTKEQQLVFEKLKLNLTAKNKNPALIHGVTGSGKTEIYIKLTEEALALGKSVIILVPEIMLTPQTVERFEEIFGDKIALRHSKLSRSEKYHTFYDFYTGSKPILIGPRSALLIPSKNLGLIIVDEEQEDSYKQDLSPRYHAVELAKFIAQSLKSLLVVGSATPRIKTYYQAQNGIVDLHELSLRHNKDKLPHAEIVDLKDEIRAENFSPISRKLKEEMDRVLLNKDQVLLFLNRRGNATFVACRDCGHVILCHNCSIPMVYHLNETEHFLNCHHCDRREAVPTHCPECHSQRIKYFGSGIDKIETEIRSLYPDKRISKVDSKTIRTKSDYTKFFQKFKKGEIDIVIGTQMIAKGLDIPNVDLVGIISADTGLHLPHYRASEKSFELLTQVSGRSGRADKIGQTIIQTYWPESAPVVAAKDHDYKSFYQSEISERQKFNYPPFCYLVRVIAEDADEDKAKKEIMKLSEKLKQNNLEFIGPGVCFYSRLHNKYRYHLIIKMDKYPNEKIVAMAKANRHLIWDAEPTNLL